MTDLCGKAMVAPGVIMVGYLLSSMLARENRTDDIND